MSPSAANFLADAIVVFHLAFVIFAFLGAAAVLWKLWVAWVHLPSMLWVIYVAAVNAVCPLTPLENNLRRDAGIVEYEGGFVDHYIKPVLYPDGLTDADQHKLAGVVITLNLACYAAVVMKWKKRRRREHLQVAATNLTPNDVSTEEAMTTAVGTFVVSVVDRKADANPSGSDCGANQNGATR